MRMKRKLRKLILIAECFKDKLKILIIIKSDFLFAIELLNKLYNYNLFLSSAAQNLNSFTFNQCIKLKAAYQLLKYI